MSRNVINIVSYLVVMCEMCGCASSSGNLKRFEYTRLCMGVRTQITLYSRDETTASNAAAAAFDRINQLDAIMSDYRADSELNRLCTRAGTGPVTVSADLERVLQQSLAVSRASHGAFDVTVGPLSSSWRKAIRNQTPPNDQELQFARRLVGFENLTIDENRHTVALLSPGMKLDLGGIGKGYAAQQAVELLKSRGTKHCLVSLAGDIVAGDSPLKTSGWNVAVGSSQELPRLSLANAAISTSGDTEQFIDINGVRHSHIIDPRTGMGVTNRLIVTVIATRGEIADALASAACVVGQDRIAELLMHFPKTAAIITKANDSSQPRLVIDPSKRLQWIGPGDSP